MHRIKCSWDGKMKFTASDEFDHKVSMDLALEAGGDDQGFRPMPMVLVGLGGCMGVDVKMILEKMKQNITALELDIKGELDESTTPRIYKKISIVFSISGENLEQDKIERAIALAEEKYCNVSAMLSRICELEYKAVII